MAPDRLHYSLLSAWRAGLVRASLTFRGPLGALLGAFGDLKPGSFSSPDPSGQLARAGDRGMTFHVTGALAPAIADP
uniref:Uncharacterized protein n=1 Tax=Sphaerodactylus townsendi TaxID=933632 RepID=A0ACB8F8Z8_9SAUR